MSTWCGKRTLNINAVVYHILSGNTLALLVSHIVKNEQLKPLRMHNISKVIGEVPKQKNINPPYHNTPLSLTTFIKI